MYFITVTMAAEEVTISYASQGLGMSDVYISETTHRYAIEATECQVAKLNSEWNIPSEPLTAFTYKFPKKSQERDLDIGRSIDEKNAEIYEHNERVVQLINPILAAMHLRPVSAHPPVQSYAASARLKYKEWLTDPTVRLRESIRFLASHDAFDVSVDLDETADKADRLAEQEEKDRLRVHWKNKIPVNIDGTKGIWDGMSERDSASRRVRWRTSQYHSFLKPHVIPETF